ITQKWIAMFPNGQEAWSEFRRTGYPKVIKVVNNLSAGKIDDEIQVRRMTFPRSEYANNAPAVSQATTLLGGSDTGGTKLWWDKK
ncbi:MAG: SusD/RagB family nutrient-binding outer membrane lipoprotein, partial [Bacteroidales bacterium]|nr:SusD/RagB family nutrient-binding outer membrane lipoprotein [Bacteroidales bacterium]